MLSSFMGLTSVKLGNELDGQNIIWYCLTSQILTFTGEESILWRGKQSRQESEVLAL